MLALLRGSSCSCPMVRRIVKSKIEEYFHGTLGISTSRIREEFKRYLGQFEENINLYSTHIALSQVLQPILATEI